MKIECDFCGYEFQFETIDEAWIEYEPNTHRVYCPNCDKTILVKTHVPFPREEPATQPTN